LLSSQRCGGSHADSRGQRWTPSTNPPKGASSPRPASYAVTAKAARDGPQSARFWRNFSGFSKKSRLGGLRLRTLVPQTFPTVDGRGPPAMRARGVGSVSDRKLDGASPARLRDRKTSAPFLVRVSSSASHARGETQRTAANHQCEARKPHSFSALILEAFNWAGSMQGQLLSDGRRRYHSQALLGS
jgi:hypothetical protein